MLAKRARKRDEEVKKLAEVTRQSEGVVISKPKSLSVILCNCHRVKGDRPGGHRT